MRRPRHQENALIQVHHSLESESRHMFKVAWATSAQRNGTHTDNITDYRVIRTDELDLFEDLLNQLTGECEPNQESLQKLIALRKQRYQPDAECVVCGREMDTFIPEYCCSGYECGCQGQPINPPMCSDCETNVTLRPHIRDILWRSIPARHRTMLTHKSIVCEIELDEYNNVSAIRSHNEYFNEAERAVVQDWLWAILLKRTHELGYGGGFKVFEVCLEIHLEKQDVTIHVLRAGADSSYPPLIPCGNCNGIGVEHCTHEITSVVGDCVVCGEHESNRMGVVSCPDCHGAGLV